MTSTTTKETKTSTESTLASPSTKTSTMEEKDFVTKNVNVNATVPRDPPPSEAAINVSSSYHVSTPQQQQGHYGHPMPPHHLPPHIHHPYYPYPGMPPPPHYDPAYAIAAAAAVNSETTKRVHISTGSPSAQTSKTVAEGNGSPASPVKSGGTASPSAGSPSSGAREPHYPPPHLYYHPHAPHPHAAVAYHRWAEAAAAAGYPPPHHRYPPPPPPHYDPYAAAMVYANNTNNISPGDQSDQSPHGHVSNGPYRFSDSTLRQEALSSHTNSPSDKNSPTTRQRSDPPTPNMAYIMEMEARADGATSPSQIEDFHREEVTSMGCTCKKTKCLKLYCQCFAVKIYCGQNCRCSTCHNLPQYDLERETAIRIILTRNPNAFETKFQKNTNLPLNNPDAMAAMRKQDVVARQPGALPMPARILSHKLGCKCRKSACMKKYCECYAGNVKCSSNCRCIGCKNMPPGGMPDRERPLPGAETKKDHAGREAAYSLTFLKHGSAEKPARTNSSDRSDVGSMPSLASEESPSVWRGLQRHAEGQKTMELNTPSIETLPSSEQTAVNALLMAARAMNGMIEPRMQLNEAETKTPPIMDGNDNDGSPDGSLRTAQRNLLGKFTSPKRKVDDTVGTSEVRRKANRRKGVSKLKKAGEYKSDETSEDGVQFAKRSRLSSLGKDVNDDYRGDGNLENHSMAMSTPAMGTRNTACKAEITPVSARCIDFKNMSVSGTKARPAPS